MWENIYKLYFVIVAIAVVLFILLAFILGVYFALLKLEGVA